MFVDYVIIGAGVSGLQLATQLRMDPSFNSKNIAIIDHSLKNENDKTFCFWEQDKGKWDHLVSKRWEMISTDDNKSPLKSISPFVYKQIRSIDFYNHCLSTLKQYHTFHFVKEKVQSIKEEEKICYVNCSRMTITCDLVFDSRYTNTFETSKKHIYLRQYCAGWIIKTKKEVFNPNAFTFMDFKVKWKETSFVYILPQSGKEALIEFTTFLTSYTPSFDELEIQLKKYIQKVYEGLDYEIILKEKGTSPPIPMTDYQFEKENTRRIIKIGTPGGWVKPSTGFSFKRTEKYVRIISEKLKKGGGMKNIIRPPQRFKYYDLLLLRVLKFQHQRAPDIFNSMLQSNHPHLLFRFLNEETSFIEDLKFMINLPKWPFIKAILYLK